MSDSTVNTKASIREKLIQKCRVVHLNYRSLRMSDKVNYVRYDSESDTENLMAKNTKSPEFNIMDVLGAYSLQDYIHVGLGLDPYNKVYVADLSARLALVGFCVISKKDILEANGKQRISRKMLVDAKKVLDEVAEYSYSNSDCEL